MLMISLSTPPLHWAIAGMAIGLVVPALLLIGGKSFGVSSTLRHMCSVSIPTTNNKYFKYDLKPHMWSLLLVLGVIIGGLISHLLHPDVVVAVGDKTNLHLQGLGVLNEGGLYPTSLFNWKNGLGIGLLVIGGILVGFGTRYANGCTSGHSITGIANLQLSSLIATIAFFIGGLTMTHFLLPLILGS